MLYELFILRKQWLAAACVILINAMGGMSVGGDTSVVNVSLWLLAIGAAVFLLLRFGLVAGCVYYFANALLILFPVTTNFSAWYANRGMFAIAVTAALAGYAFYASLSGQKLFEGKLLEE